MKAVMLMANGGPENYKLVDAERFAGPLPQGTVRVRMGMVAISGSEVYGRRGDVKTKFFENGEFKWKIYDGAGMGTPPFVAGKEGAGEVIEVGPGVTMIKVGDRICWMSAQLKKPYTGGLAEECVLQADFAFVIPEGVTYAEALACQSTGLTAHYLAMDCYTGDAGEWAVVTIAGGSLGTTLTQILRMRGVRVIGVVSGPEKVEACKRSGCEHVIVGYEGYSEKVRELVGGSLVMADRRFTVDMSGAAVVYEGLGGNWWKEAANAVRVRASIVLYGVATEWFADNIDVSYLQQKGSLSLIAPAAADYWMPLDRARVRFAEMCEWIKEGKLKPEIGATFPMEQTSEAFALYDSRKAAGRIYISVR